MKNLFISSIFLVSILSLTSLVFADNSFNFTHVDYNTQIPVDMVGYNSSLIAIVGNDTSTGHGFLKVVNSAGSVICQNTSAFVYDDGSPHYFLPSRIAAVDDLFYVTTYSTGGYMMVWSYFWNCTEYANVITEFALDEPYTQNLPIVYSDDDYVYVTYHALDSLWVEKWLYGLWADRELGWDYKDLENLTSNNNLGSLPEYDSTIEMHEKVLTVFTTINDGAFRVAWVRVDDDINLINWAIDFSGENLAPSLAHSSILLYAGNVSDEEGYYYLQITPSSPYGIIANISTTISGLGLSFNGNPYTVGSNYLINSMYYNNTKKQLILTGGYYTGGLTLAAIINVSNDFSKENKTSQSLSGFSSYMVTNGSSIVEDSTGGYFTIGKNAGKTIFGKWLAREDLEGITLVNLTVSPTSFNQSCTDINFLIQITGGYQPYMIKLYTNDSVTPFTLSGGPNPSVYAQYKTITWNDFCFVNLGQHCAYAQVNDDTYYLNSSTVCFNVNEPTIAPFTLSVSPRPNPPNALAQFDEVFNTTEIYNATAPYNVTVFMIYNGVYNIVGTCTGIIEHGTCNGLLTLAQLLPLVGYNFNANVNFTAWAYDSMGNMRMSSNTSVNIDTPTSSSGMVNYTGGSLIPFTSIGDATSTITSVLFTSMGLWTILLLGACTWLEYITKSGGRVFGIVLIIGITVLSIFGIYPIWFLFIEGILAIGIVVIMVNKGTG